MSCSKILGEGFGVHRMQGLRFRAFTLSSGMVLRKGGVGNLRSLEEGFGTLRSFKI